jgi:hypothetical protein
MGGRGSGTWKRFGVKPTTDNFLSIDVRWLARQRLLRADGQCRSLWFKWRDMLSSLAVVELPDRTMRLTWNNQTYRIALLGTPTHFGNTRAWFECPRCKARVAILYAGALLACRQCLGLTYSTCRDSAADRALRRVTKIRARLGWPSSIMSNADNRIPKRMRLRTFRLLKARHDELIARWCYLVMVNFRAARRFNGPLRTSRGRRLFSAETNAWPSIGPATEKSLCWRVRGIKACLTGPGGV